MNTRWRKVWADMRAYRGQVALMVVVMALGTAGMVTALDARSVLTRAIPASFDAAAAPDVVLWFDHVDDTLLAEAAARPGVAAVSAQRVSFSRIIGGDGRELPMRLSLVRDPLASAVGRVHQHAGAAPGPAGLWVEQSAAAMLGATPGQRLRVRTPGGGQVDVPLAGYLHDPSVAPSTQERLVYAWATPDMAAQLMQNARPDQLLVKMAARPTFEDAIELSNDLAAWARKAHRAPLRIEARPASHPHAVLMNALLRVLGVLSAIAFVSSAAWAAYLVALWMRREVRAVGILKALGARSHQIAAQYGALVMPVVVLSAALGLPLGVAGGEWLVRWQAESLNIDVSNPTVPLALRLLECALALGLPMLAVAGPIARAARMTPRQAMQDAGVGMPGLSAGRRSGRHGLASDGRIGRLASALARRVRWPGGMQWTLALRNTWRRPWRLALIVLALASGGALLLTTHSNYDSLMAVIDHSLAQQGHDIELVLQRPAPAAQLEGLLRELPGVQRVEAWRRSGVRLVNIAAQASMHEGNRVALVGHPPASPLMRLTVVAGRAAAPDAADEVLATRSLLAAQAQVQLGQTLSLRHRDRTVTVRLVGLVDEIGQPTLYAPMASFEAITGQADGANTLRVKAVANAPLEPLARTLDQTLLDAQHTPAQVITRELVRDGLDEHFKVVGDFIRLVALATALVGAIWLAASSAMNVHERTREIGVLRALGATPRGIAGLFVAEATSVLVLTGLIAVALSLVLTSTLNRAAETGLLHVAVPLQFSWLGLGILACAAVVVLLAVVVAMAGVLRRSVREGLASA